MGGNGTPDRDPSLFLDLLLQRSIDKHAASESSKWPVVFDRGIPDCIAYAVLLGVDPMPSVLASRRYSYSRQVLILEPWEDIYTTDEERTMTFKDTAPFQAAIKDAYEQAGYVLVEVPRDSVEKRAAFVRCFIQPWKGLLDRI